MVPFSHSTAMRSPLSYIGGKNRSADRIIAMIPQHVTFTEVFGGGAQVLCKKPPSRVEILNDLDGSVVNFFRCVQQHHEEFVRCLKYVLVSREWFKIFLEQNPATLTDIQRAVRFYYLQKNCFAGLVHGQHYAAKVVSAPGFNPNRFREIFDKLHERLAHVQIECLPFEKFIPRFDRPTTVHFIDPPYWRRKLYNFNLSDDDYQTLADILRSIKGKFILTVDDVPELRELFSWATLTETKVTYTSQREAGKRYAELIITNFEPPTGTIQS